MFFNCEYFFKALVNLDKDFELHWCKCWNIMYLEYNILLLPNAVVNIRACSYVTMGYL